MYRGPLLRFVCAFLLLLSIGCASSAPKERLCITGARIWGQQGLQDLFVEDGQIAEIRPSTGADIPGVRAEGGWLLPGFRDAHVHVYSGALALESADLSGARSVSEILAALTAHAAKVEPGAWVIGRGFSYELGLGEALPEAAMLDAAFPDRPVFLESYDGHAGWVNSRALERAGVTSATIDPAGGRIVRDAEGRATGYLLETAMAVVESKIPPPSLAARKAMLRRALRYLLELGLTEVEDMNVEPELIPLYAELDDEGELPMTVMLSPSLSGDLELYARLRARYERPRIRFGRLKTFVDGVVESKTAFLLEPYADDTVRGEARWTEAALEVRVREAVAHGFAVAMHAVGDAAVRLALDVFARVPKVPGIAHRIEHIEVLDPSDAPRFAALEVEASMQPFHANPFGDAPEEGVWARNLGAARLNRTFPWRTLSEAGATLRFGSDWPVMSAAPLQGLAVALTRQDAEGRPQNGFIAKEKLDLEAAILAYSGRGRIEVGQVADLVLLSPKVELDSPRSLHADQGVRAVVVSGKLAWAREASAQKVPEVGLSK